MGWSGCGIPTSLTTLCYLLDRPGEINLNNLNSKAVPNGDGANEI